MSEIRTHFIVNKLYHRLLWADLIYRQATLEFIIETDIENMAEEFTMRLIEYSPTLGNEEETLS